MAMVMGMPVQASASAPALAPNNIPGANSDDDGANASEADAANPAPQPPDSDSRSSTLPHRTKESFAALQVNRYMERDALYNAAHVETVLKNTAWREGRSAQIRGYQRMRDKQGPEWPKYPPAVLYGEGYSGYGNGYTETNGPARILYPADKRRARKRTTPLLKCNRKDMRMQAEQHEELVPVRIHVDLDKIRLRDTFTFNLHERLVSVELFAAQLVEDIGLKPPLAQPVYEQVVAQMHDQLTDFYPFVFSDEDALDPELPYSAYKNDEMRVLVKLNITIGVHTLVDQFEWDINNPLNSPEIFAASMARDLALSGEFATAIAHCIREQTQLFTHSLYSVGHTFDGRPVEDPDLVSAFLPSPLPVIFRPQQQAKDYAPYLYENTEAELERTETMFSREQRRQKRSVNRRGGPQLPDLKERQRTIRTSIVSTVLPGAVPTLDKSCLFKRAAGPSGTGRGGRRVARGDGDLSDSDDSDESVPDSPAASQLPSGTARTRGVRGAATAAVQRMAVLGRSETPEVAASALMFHHEPRASGGRAAAAAAATAGAVVGRFVQRESTRDETEEPSEEPPSRIVMLRVNPARLKRLWQELRTPKPHTPVIAPTSHPAGHATPRSATGPSPNPLTPGQHPSGGAASSLRAGSGATAPFQPVPSERIDAQPPLPSGAHPLAPDPPAWLTEALEDMRPSWPRDNFEVAMRYCWVDKTRPGGNPTPMPQTQNSPPHLANPNIAYVWVPRIRCLDCPGKLYTPGLGNFETHLKNSNHKKNVENRIASANNKKQQQQQPISSAAGSGA